MAALHGQPDFDHRARIWRAADVQRSVAAVQAFESTPKIPQADAPLPAAFEYLKRCAGAGISNGEHQLSAPLVPLDKRADPHFAAQALLRDAVLHGVLYKRLKNKWRHANAHIALTVPRSVTAPMRPSQAPSCSTAATPSPKAQP